MRAILTAALLLAAVPANALDLVTVSSAAGPITVSRGIAYKMQGFVGDVVARGFKGRVHCYARSGHIRHSLHYRGEACDFAQRGWNRTVHVMYRAGDLARKWGLRDGCSFRDCGHIDSGAGLRSYARATQIVQGANVEPDRW